MRTASQKIAKRYARALLEIGREDGQMDLYGEQLEQMAALLGASEELASALSNPIFKMEERIKLLDTFLEKLGLSRIVANFFRLLLERGRIALAGQIARAYQMLLDEEKGITRAVVYTAAPLNTEELERLKQALEKVAAGRKVEVEVQEDSSLIGGVVARIGDLVLDGSVKTQLENLKETLRRGEYA